MSLATIIDQHTISESIFRMKLETASIAETCEPGQFVHMLINTSLHPLLRRPFSIHRSDPSAGNIDLLYRVIGKGTSLMSRLRPGETVDLIGPLGRGFDLNGAERNAVVVAGGMGSAPVFFLINRLLERDTPVTLYWGVRTGDELYDLDWLKDKGVTVHIASEDGSVGFHGMVTDLLTEHLLTLRGPDDGPLQAGFVCGPKPMLKAMQRICRENPIHWQVSVEEIMACGEGICMGCAQPMAKGGYGLVCKDGPVFDLQEIVIYE